MVSLTDSYLEGVKKRSEEEMQDWAVLVAGVTEEDASHLHFNGAGLVTCRMPQDVFVGELEDDGITAGGAALVWSALSQRRFQITPQVSCVRADVYSTGP
jgi:hypothetical protein